MPPTFRTATPADRAALSTLDNSFTTGTVFEVNATGHGFELCERPVVPPLHKVFPAEEPAEADHTIVAVAERVVGGIELDLHSWNRRLTIANIAIAPEHRGRGLGRALLERGLAHGRAHGARTCWLEVSSVNAPAVHAYRRWGFTLCGLDTTLYTGTESEGETALFMARSLA
ncbi:ribosomal protein S18 acetylase RimI-like enzyme [Crossiella equi]|uniref:Ribosomal protein S18 acetylase RimI-like enzyme n=1 Tax=Crossiella equi TaxID=130796 RepID=A0ABS5AR88_9PSEU|nr:GNAT family N-acetyltransferase [Crossiella equi]MBP2479073.1 ribosomal protein S18 acetylase RimI-like enzyme [Crossiella equi]